MSLEYRVTPLPAVWPGTRTPEGARRRSPYKTVWSRALRLLAKEVGRLDGRNVEIALDVAPRHLRTDGQLRADARPVSPAVVVSFTTPSGRLVLASDRYLGWQNNVDVVGRALERLRLVDRDGLLQGRQYEGLKQIPARTGDALTAEQAAAEVVDAAGRRPEWAGSVLQDRDTARVVVREARAATHPDRTGDRIRYDVVDAAASVLLRHHEGG